MKKMYISMKDGKQRCCFQVLVTLAVIVAPAAFVVIALFGLSLLTTVLFILAGIINIYLIKIFYTMRKYSQVPNVANHHQPQDVECNNGSSEYDDLPLKPPSYDTVMLEDKMNRAHGGSPAVHLPVPKTVPLTCQGENDDVTTPKKSTDADLPLLSTSNTGKII